MRLLCKIYKRVIIMKSSLLNVMSQRVVQIEGVGSLATHGVLPANGVVGAAIRRVVSKVFATGGAIVEECAEEAHSLCAFVGP